MEKWRRKSNYHHRKPSLGGNSNWHQNIPYWEKRFVSSVGSISWKKFLEAKEFTHLYDNIMKWDDCAGEEAFHTAKNRFYAQFHGLPCDVESHNPDLYNDKIDWNAQMDWNLIQDLESEPVALGGASQHEPVVIFEDVLPDPYKDYSPYGWGDSDDMKKDQSAINWDDCIDNGGGNGWWNTDSYESHKTWRFHGKNNQRRNNGSYANWRKSTGQSYESQHVHGSTFQAHGSQRIHVHQ